MDAADRAQVQIELEESLRRRATDYVRPVSAERCSDCCEDIPEARRVAAQGCTRCAYCEGLREKGARR